MQVVKNSIEKFKQNTKIIQIIQKEERKGNKETQNRRNKQKTDNKMADLNLKYQ